MKFNNPKSLDQESKNIYYKMQTKKNRNDIQKNRITKIPTRVGSVMLEGPIHEDFKERLCCQGMDQ